MRKTDTDAGKQAQLPPPSRQNSQQQDYSPQSRLPQEPLQRVNRIHQQRESLNRTGKLNQPQAGSQASKLERELNKVQQIQAARPDLFSQHQLIPLKEQLLMMQR